jgi:hypothetical protein
LAKQVGKVFHGFPIATKQGKPKQMNRWLANESLLASGPWEQMVLAADDQDAGKDADHQHDDEYPEQSARRRRLIDENRLLVAQRVQRVPGISPFDAPEPEDILGFVFHEERI